MVDRRRAVADSRGRGNDYGDDDVCCSRREGRETA